MTARERVSIAVAVSLGTIGAVATGAIAVLISIGKEPSPALATIAATSVAALAGALTIPPPHRGHDDG